MRRPAPIEKETQGTAKPSLASRCFRQARRPCRQYVDLPRRRRHLLPQSFFSVRYFPGVVNPGGTEPVKKVAAERQTRSMGESKTGLGTMERSMPIRLRPAREEDPAAPRELFLSRRTGGMAGTAPGISRTPGRPSGGTASRWRSGRSPAYGSARRRPGPSGRRRCRCPGGGQGFCGTPFSGKAGASGSRRESRTGGLTSGQEAE